MSAGGCSQLLQQPLDHAAAPAEGGSLAASRGIGEGFTHRKAIVEQHDMDGAAAPEQAGEGTGPTRLCEHRNQAGDGEDSQQKQQHLLE